MSSKVYIIVLNYKNWSDTLECMESVLRSDYQDYCLVVIDNSSPNDSWERLDAWRRGEIEAVPAHLGMRLYSEPHTAKPVDAVMLTESDAEAYCGDYRIVMVKANKNGGFAAGNNIGIKLTQRLSPESDVWLLNNDTVIASDALRRFAEHAARCREAHDRVGIIGGKLYCYDAPDILQGICGYYRRLSGISYPVGGGEIDHGQYDAFQPNTENFILGASMYVMNEFISDTGLMEEDYFLYFEELDWTIRGMRRNWSSAFCPRAVVYHKEGRSIGSNIILNRRSELADHYGISNRIKITKRYFPFFLPTVLAGLVVTFVRRIFSAQWKRACKTLPQAIWQGLFK